MSRKTYISESPLGFGVFAKEPILPGETIFYLNGRLIDFAASKLEMGEYSVQIGLDTYVDPISPGRFLNHSCNPNSGFVNDITLIAIAPIEVGDEIRFDYSTTMLERHWELQCRCEAANCRRRIRDFDLIPGDLQTRYLRMGIVQNFIVSETERMAAIRRVAA
jgi:hypothetical protein